MLVSDTTNRRPQMADPTEIVDTYIDMWNETDAALRAEHIAQAWAPGASYLDPALEANGYEELSKIVEAVHERFPGYRFQRLSEVDVHHNQVRFAWHLAGPGGDIAAAGIDIGTLAPDGRLERITGFFGDLQERAA